MFPLFKLAATVAWLVLMAYFITSPPEGITAGSSTHVIGILAIVVVGVAVMLLSLGREISSQRDMGSGLMVNRRGWQFWQREDKEDERAVRNRQRDEANDEYRENIRGAFRRNQRRRRP